MLPITIHKYIVRFLVLSCHIISESILIILICAMDSNLYLCSLRKAVLLLGSLTIHPVAMYNALVFVNIQVCIFRFLNREYARGSCL